MKKLIIFVALAMFVVSAAPVMGAVTGSRHDCVTTWGAGARQGVCSYCHTPHSAQGARLWPSTPDASALTNYGLIGALCYSCHSLATLGTGIPTVVSTVYNAALTNHPRAIGALPNTDAATGVTWPYTDEAAPMECSSCHDPHNQTAAGVAGMGVARNFLRAPYYEGTAAVPTDLFCSNCHSARVAVGSQNGTAGSPDGTHPVGNLVVDGRLNTVTGTVDMGVAAFNVAYGTQGGHEADLTGIAGGVVCVTCHRPHGANARLLVQTRADASGYNTICESCHNVHPSLSSAGTTMARHPVDAGTGGPPYVSSGGETLSITAFATALGSTVESNALNAWQGTSGEVVCLSCHIPHEADGGTQILREEKISDNTGICDDCHGVVFTGYDSHPVDVALTNEDGGTWPNNGSLPLFTTPSGTDRLICITCHSGHSGEAGATFLLRREDTDSEICVDCHTALNTTATAVYAAGVNSANPSQYITEAQYGGTDFAAGLGTRMGTHAAYRAVATPAYQVALGAGSAAAETGNTMPLGNSYGTGGLNIICQSCHTPHGANATGGWSSTTAGSSNLLFLQNGYGGARTGDNGGAGGVNGDFNPGDDSYCQVCHRPSGTHPVQSWLVSKTNAAVNTTSTAYSNGAATAPADYTAADVMTCESCHAPHAATTNTGSYVIEAGTSATNTIGGAKPTDQNRDTLCALCHTY